MKRTKYRRIATALAVISIPLLSACGSSDPTKNNPTGSVPGAQFGVGGCVPLGSQIPFTAQNATVINRKVLAGQIPNQGAYGQVVLGGAAAPTTGGYGGQYMGSGAYGTINMSITPMQVAQPQQPGYPTYTQGIPGLTGYGQSQVSASGYIQVNALAQQDITYKVQMGQIQIPGVTNPYGAGGYGYPQTYPGAYPQQQPVQPQGQICVAGVAISLNISNANQLYIGDVFLYLASTTNPVNSGHGYVLEF